MPDRPSTEFGYEQQDVPAPYLVYTGVGVLVTVVLVLLTCAYMLGLFSEDVAPMEATRIERTLVEPPSPRVQVNSSIELESLRDQALDRLNTYGWVDRGRDIAHIPIERAMGLLEEHGWPSREWREE